MIAINTDWREATPVVFSFLSYVALISVFGFRILKNSRRRNQVIGQVHELRIRFLERLREEHAKTLPVHAELLKACIGLESRRHCAERQRAAAWDLFSVALLMGLSGGFCIASTMLIAAPLEVRPKVSLIDFCVFGLPPVLFLIVGGYLAISGSRRFEYLNFAIALANSQLVLAGIKIPSRDELAWEVVPIVAAPPQLSQP